jgi:hypothetical protein
MLDFLRRLFKRVEPVSPVPSPTQAKAGKRGYKGKRKKHFWLDAAMADILKPGSYEVRIPMSVPLNSARALLCQRLTTRFGRGKYATRSMGGQVVSVLILQS